MKSVLIQPRVCAEPAYPLGLASLVPGLEESGFRVRGYDLAFDSSTNILEACARADVVGITVMSTTLEQVSSLVSSIKAAVGSRRVPIVLGGPHATLFPRNSLERTGADAALSGDGEHEVGRLFEAAVRSETPPIPGVLWRGSKAVRPPVEPRVRPLDEAPFPDRNVFSIRRYTFAMRSEVRPYTTMVTSRGCRRICSHCPGPALHPEGYRARSPEHVYSEMFQLFQRFGVKDIHFEDDDILGDPDRLEQLCERLVARPFPVVWECVNGIPPERLDARVIASMARAGCRSLVLSIETLAGPRCDDGGRREAAARLQHIREVVQVATSYGITTGGYFMIGLPGERRSDTVATVLESYRLGLSRANYSPFQRIPGAAGVRGAAVAAGGTAWEKWNRAAAALAQVAFYLRPGPLQTLSRDLARTPELLPAMVDRALELVGRPSSTR